MTATPGATDGGSGGDAANALYVHTYAVRPSQEPCNGQVATDSCWTDVPLHLPNTQDLSENLSSGSGGRDVVLTHMGAL